MRHNTNLFRRRSFSLGILREVELMNKTKFETARDAEVELAMPIISESKTHVREIQDSRGYFKIGADWGAAYERERAAGLLDDLRAVLLGREYKRKCEPCENNDLIFQDLEKALKAFEDQD